MKLNFSSNNLSTQNTYSHKNLFSDEIKTKKITSNAKLIPTHESKLSSIDLYDKLAAIDKYSN